MENAIPSNLHGPILTAIIGKPPRAGVKLLINRRLTPAHSKHRTFIVRHDGGYTEWRATRLSILVLFIVHPLRKLASAASSLNLDKLRLGVRGHDFNQAAAGWPFLVRGPFVERSEAGKYLIAVLPPWFGFPKLIHTYSAIKESGVHVEKSAFGIHLRFIGVSKVTGRIATTSELSGSPESFPAKDAVS